MPRSKTRQEVLAAFAAALKAKPTDAMPAIALLIQRLSADPKAYPKEFIAGLQALIVEYFKAPLAIDGILGPRTYYAVMCVWDLLQTTRAGAPMFVGGIATHFGGPEDSWDRCNGQSWFPVARQGESPRDYYRRVPEWVRSHLDPDMGCLSRWPQTTDEKGVRRPAGVSYFLKGDYAALRIEPKSPLGQAAREGRVWVEVVNAKDPSKVAVARVTDYGPAIRVSATIDLSPDVHARVRGPGNAVLFRIRVDAARVEED